MIPKMRINMQREEQRTVSAAASEIVRYIEHGAAGMGTETIVEVLEYIYSNYEKQGEVHPKLIALYFELSSELISGRSPW